MASMHRISSKAMISLLVLVIQNSLLVVMTRFSLMNATPAENYHTSTLVLNQEIVKMIMCLILYGFDDPWNRPQQNLDVSEHVEKVTQVVDESEMQILLIMSKQAHLLDGGRPQRECTAAYSLAHEEELNECNGSSEWMTHAVVEAGVAGNISCHLADKYATGHKGLTLPKRAGKSHNGVTVRPVECGATEFQPSSFVVSSDPVPNASTSGGGIAEMGGTSKDKLSAPLRVHRRILFTLKRTHGHVRFCCAMLSLSVWRRDTLKLLIPALLFNLQNFLIFVGLSNLDAVSFQVWSQTKLLSTALFSVWLLDRRLSVMQWMSLVALTVGVLGAQLGAPKPTRSSNSTTSHIPLRPHECLSDCADAEQTHVDVARGPQMSALIGIAACVLSGMSSSYASVYFEKVVKTTSRSLSVRNIQLSLFGIPLAFFSMLVLDVVPNWYASVRCGQRVHWNIFSAPAAEVWATSPRAAGCPVRPLYFWQRYDHLLTWGLVAIHALGGLLVALVVKHADNILKGFATGVAVIVSGLMSSVVLGYQPSLAFVLGAALVTGSGIVFHRFEPKQ